MPAKLAEVIRHACAANKNLLFEVLARSIAVPSVSGEEAVQAGVLAHFFEEHKIPFARSPEGSLVAILLPSVFSARLAQASDLPFDRWSEIAREALDLARKRETRTPEISGQALSVLHDGMPPENSPEKSEKMSETAAKGGLLALNAHMDVVEAGDPASWTHNPFVATVEKDRIYGRGTCDMKGALAAMAVSLVVGRDLMTTGYSLHMPVVACFVPEEERAEGFAFSKLLGHWGFRPTCVLLGEPSSGAIARGQRGKLELHLRAQGRRTHTSVPETGENAATRIAHAALAIDRFDRAERARVGSAPASLLERTTLVMTAMRTLPFHRSFVPDVAEAYVTGRLGRGVTRASLLEALARDPDWPCDLEIETTVAKQVSKDGGKKEDWLTDHPAWELPIDHPFAQRVAAVHAELFGSAPAFAIWPFSTDGVASAGRYGIPTLGYGPGTPETAHIVDEYVDTDALMRAFMLYVALPFAGF
ncbi:MAG: M20/M25/M40 family metallo-hydrolase [Candidatus Ozemobacteraceae bacterium]